MRRDDDERSGDGGVRQARKPRADVDETRRLETLQREEDTSAINPTGVAKRIFVQEPGEMERMSEH